MRYKAIEISFINHGTIRFENNWTDYDYVKDFIVIKNGEVWVAMYNAKEVFSVVLIPEEVQYANHTAR